MSADIIFPRKLYVVLYADDDDDDVHIEATNKAQ